MQGRSSFQTLRTKGLGLVLAGATALSGCNVTDMLGSAAEEDRTRVTAAFVQAADPQAPIGEAEHPQVVKANGGAYEDKRLEALLAVIVAELVAAEPSGKKDDPAHAYRVTILDSPTVNAFALPGGYLYVTRGLIALANDASEVAAVLAHEMAHVDASHGVERIEATKASDIATRVAAEVVSSGAASALAKASTGRKLASFSQRQELEADHLGIRRAGNAGFDPHAAQRFLVQMRRWADHRGGATAAAAGGKGADMLSTHPSTPERVALARSHAERFGPRDAALGLRDRYLEGVDGLVYGDRADQGLVRGRTYAHKALGLAFEVPEGFSLRNKGNTALATGPDQMAVRFDAVPRAGAGGQSVREYIASGWVNGIDSASIQTAKRAGMSLATGKARAGAFDFAVAVFADDANFYRFITAAPKGASQLAAVSRDVSGSVRRLDEAQRAALKPLRLRIVTVEEGETVASLAKRMAAGGEGLLRTLNALDDGAVVEAGQKLKIVSAR